MVKILIIDDEANPINFYKQFITFAFEKTINKVFEIVTASNGLEGLEIFKRDDKIVLIATDVSMPVMDGYEMVKRIRELNRPVRIVICTGMEEPDENHDVDRYLFKPEVIHGLIEEIKMIVDKLIYPHGIDR